MSPDRRQHRGAHPSDAELFGEGSVAVLRLAVAELSWLLSRGYQTKSAVKLVGDRHALRERQRLAVARAACSDESLARRASTRAGAGEAAGAELVVDGFNLVITVEAALGGGPLLRGRDGVVRDLSSVHGSYRSVEETDEAILLAGEALESLGPAGVLWLLDKPVSNSGRLAARLRQKAEARGWPWEVEVVFNPDREIVGSPRLALTSDSNVLDRAARWLDFNDYLLRRRVPRAWVVDLGGDTSSLTPPAGKP